MAIINRVKAILDGEDYNEKRLNEYVDMVVDRLCLRLGEETLPRRWETVAALCVVKLHRRYYYEGISTENDGGISVNFVDDILSEYQSEINAYKTTSKGVRFL